MTQRKWLIALPIMAILLALCVGMVAIAVITIRQVGGGGLSLWGLNMATVSAEAEETQDFEIDAPVLVVVDNPCGGDVEVRTGPDGKINLVARKKAWGFNQAGADAALAKIQLDLQQDGSTLRLGLKDTDTLCRGLRNNRPPSVDFILTVPVETQVQAAVQFGRLDLQGTSGAAELRSQFGDITVKGVQGALLVETSNGAVTLEDVQAAEAEINLSTSFGDIRIKQVGGQALTVKSGNGRIEVDAAVISDTVSLTTDFGAVTWQNGTAQTLNARTQNGRIELRDLVLQGKLEVSSDFGDIMVADVSAASYQGETKNGRVSIEGAVGDVTASSDFGDIEVSGLEALVFNLSTQSGAIIFDGELGEGQNIAKTQFGNVTVRLPSAASFDFDLETSFGKIDVQFPLTIQGTPNEKHWQGQANDGGPSLGISTQNGNINIETR